MYFIHIHIFFLFKRFFSLKSIPWLQTAVCNFWGPAQNINFPGEKQLNKQKFPGNFCLTIQIYLISIYIIDAWNFDWNLQVFFVFNISQYMVIFNSHLPVSRQSADLFYASHGMTLGVHSNLLPPFPHLLQQVELFV